MSEQRKTEITVGAAVADLSDEIVSQWNALGDTIARSVQQRTRLEEEHGQQERVAHVRELDRLRAALAESEAKVTAVARESAARLDATRREYEMKLSSLQQALEQADRPVDRPRFTAAAAAPLPVEEVDEAYGEEGEWETDPPRKTWQSVLAGVQDSVGERWAGVRSGPYLIPVVGFLAGLAVMVSLYPLLHRPSTGLAKENVTATLQSSAPLSTSEAATSTRGVSRTAGAILPADPEASANTARTEVSAATVSAAPPPKAAAAEGYAVLLAGGRLLTPDKPGAPSAAYEAQLAMRAGYDSISVYQRNDRYMAAILFSSREEAEKGLKSINADFDSRWKKTSSIVPVSDWCRVKGAMQPVVINGVEVAVWACNKSPS